MVARDGDYIFPSNEHLSSIHVSQSDSSEIPGGHHKGHIDLIFCDVDEQKNSIIAKKLEILPGVARTTVNGPMLDLGIANGHHAFDIVSNIIELLKDEKYITHDEVIEIYKGLGLTESPVKGGRKNGRI